LVPAGDEENSFYRIGKYWVHTVSEESGGKSGDVLEGSSVFTVAGVISK